MLTTSASGIPERIGKYEIRGELGRGGFGQVYLGYDPTVGRQVAIKVLTPGGDPSKLRRFRTEAAAAGNLRHKNIVTIHEFGEDHGTFFMVMEYLEGRDLKEVMRSSNPPSLLERVRIMSQAAEGLLCAHQHGIIHRDVKPANIMVLDDGSVKVMDFGIARLLSADSSRLTESGFLIGSVFYMAPEQLSGQEVDARCDIWAFGAIYYELLCGRHPFEAPDAASAMFRIVQREPEPIEVAFPQCPSALTAVLARLLNKDRDSRYQTFEDVSFDTAPILFDLESQQADQLAAQATDLIKVGDLDQTQSLVKRILALDPAHRQGRALRQQVQTEIQRRSTRVRARGFVEQSERAAGERDYAAAIEAVEAAIRVDPGETSFQARLAELRAAKQRADLAAKLVASAGENLLLGDLSEAFRLLNEALGAEPGNFEAQRLLNDVRDRIVKRDAEKRLREGLTKAKGLVALRSFDEAIQILEDLIGQGPASDEVRTTLTLARQERDEYNRQHRLQAELDAAKSELKANQFQAAIDRLEPLATEPSVRRDVVGLLAYARAELEAALNQAQIEAAAAEAWRLFKAQEYDRAVTQAEAALLAFPGEPSLFKLRQTMVTERAEHQRIKFIQQALDEAAELERDNRLEQASLHLHKALQRYPAAPLLTEALARTKQKQTEQQEKARAAALERDLKRVDDLIEQGQLDRASRLLTQMRTTYPGEARVGSLLAQIEADQKRSKALDALLGEIQGYLDAKEHGRALEAATRGRKEFGPDAQLLALEAKAEKLRARKDLLDRAQAAYGARDWRLATATLESLLQQDANDGEARRLLDQVLEQKRAAELAEAQRIRIIEQALAESAELERKDQLKQACVPLEKALQRYPAESTLADALARMQQKLARQEQERRAALERDLKQADTYLNQGQLPEAEQLSAKLTTAYPSDVRVVALLGRIEAEQERRSLERKRELERIAAFERDLQQADALIEQGQLDQAAQLLARLKASHPSEARIAALQTRVQVEQKRRKALNALRHEIERYLDGDQLDRAVEALARGRKEFGPDSELKVLEARAERLRARNAALESAQAALRERNWPRATATIESLLREDPQDAEARALLDEVLDQKRLAELAEAQRIRFLEQTLAESAELEQSGHLEQACASLEKALQRYPAEPGLTDALALRRKKLAQQGQERRAELERDLKQADTLLDQGQLDRATQLFTKLNAAYPNDARVTSLFSRVEAEQQRQKVAEQQERARIAALERDLMKADALIEQEQMDAAAQLLAKLQSANPGDAKVAAVLARLQAEQKRLNALSALCAETQRNLDANQPEEALKAAARGRKEFGADPRLSALEAAAKKMRARKDALDRANAALREHDWQLAAAPLQAILLQDPKDSEARSLLEQVQEGERADQLNKRCDIGREEAAKLVQDQRFEEAARRLRALQNEFPGDAAVAEDLKRVLDAHAAHSLAEHQRAIQLLLSESSRLMDQGHFQEALEHVESVCAKYPAEQEPLRLRDEIRERSRAAEESKKQAEERERKLAAEAKLEAERQRAAQEAERVRLKEEARLREAAEQKRLEQEELERRVQADQESAAAIRRANELRVARDFSTALELMEQTIARLGSRPDLADLRDRLVADHKRATAARATLDQARAALNAGQIQIAEDLASRLESVFPDEVDTRELRAAIVARTELERVRQEIETALQQAEGIRAKGQFEAALGVLDAALHRHPGAKELESARARIKREEEISRQEQARKQAFEEIAALPGLVNEASDEAALGKLSRRGEELGAAYPADKHFSKAAKTVARAVTQRRAQLKAAKNAAPKGAASTVAPEPTAAKGPPPVIPVALRAQTTIPIPARVSFRKPQIAIAAGAIVVLGALLIWKVRGPAGPVLTVSTDPPGVTITVGNLTCATPDCALHLPAGSYHLRAQKPGYHVADTQVEIGTAAPAPVQLALTPLSARLLVSTNFRRGSIALDGGTPAPMKEGQFAMDSVAPGTHSLQVTSPDGQAAVSFEEAVGQPPKLLSGPTATDAHAIVVSGSGATAEVLCDCLAGDVFVDGRPAGSLSNGRITLSSVAAGTHQFRIAASDGNRETVVSLQEDPSLSLFLTADRDVGTLVVETGVDGARVILDGAPQAELTQGGLLRLNVPVKQHRVKVDKAGYLAGGETSVDVKKGDLKRISFVLTPRDATLSIRGATPGTRVQIDGDAVGTVAPDGTLQTNVRAGSHTIDLTRAGYSSRKLNGIGFEPGGTVNLGRTEVELAEIRTPLPTPAPTPAPPPPTPVKPAPAVPDPRAVEAEEWDRLRDSKNLDQLEAFRAKYPSGANSEQASKRIEQVEWENIQNSRDAGVFEAFLKKHPNGANSDQARRRSEDIDWAGVNKQNADQIRAFLQRHPGPPLAADANGALAALQQANRSAADRLAVRQVLDQYAQAYSRRDTNAVKAIWPGTPTKALDQLTARTTRSVTLTLMPQGDASINGDTATITCRRNLQVQTVDTPRPLTNEDTATVKLRRSGTSWIIDSIQ